MTAVRGACNNAWVIVHSRSVNEYYSYKVTPAGVSGPVISVIGTGDYEPDYRVGVIKISPDREKMVAVKMGYPGPDEIEVELYDFDAATGVISV